MFRRRTKAYGFGKTQGWVINDRIFIFGWTKLLMDPFAQKFTFGVNLPSLGPSKM